MPTGTLLIGVEEGHNLEDRGFVTKQNPLCQINIGSITHKTDAARHGGANPIWEERCGLVQMVEIGFDDVELPICHTVHVEYSDPKFPVLFYIALPAYTTTTYVLLHAGLWRTLMMQLQQRQRSLSGVNITLQKAMR